MSSAAIGIDLGTYNSCVAVFENNTVEIIQNELGRIITPSYVAFHDYDEFIVGVVAEELAAQIPESCIFEVQRLIGRKFTDPKIQKYIKKLPFQIIQGNNDNPLIKLPNGKTFLPEQLSGKILSYLREQAENYLGMEVSNAVITVPAYFNDAERQATREAGAIAGLNVRIINEPTAASIAYNFLSNPQHTKIILVFDLNVSTFDVSLLKIEGSDFKILEIDGDSDFGKEDFVDTMVQYCLEEFKKKEGIDLNAEINSSSIDIFRKAKRLRILKKFCERETKHLLKAISIYVGLDAFYGETDLNIRITHNTFELINKNNFDKCFDTLNRIVRTAKLNKSDIDDVILVGCSSKIPMMQAKIANYFNGKKPLETIKGDQVVAYGAAIQARKFFEIQDESPKQYDKMAQLEAKVSELFRQKGWDFDEDMVAELQNWLKYRDQ